MKFEIRFENNSKLNFSLIFLCVRSSIRITVKLSNLMRAKQKSNRMQQEMLRMIDYWYGWFPAFHLVRIKFREIHSSY